MHKIAAAFVKAQAKFSPAIKEATNPHYRSKYADLSNCVNAVLDSLNSNGIALLQKCHECESGVLVETVFIHESGEVLEAGKLHVPASKQDPQGYGSALTYARRYSLMAACGIAPEDDDGNSASGKGKTGLADNVVIDYLNTIADSDDMDALKKNFAAAVEAARKVSDKAAETKFVSAKDKRKGELEK